MGNHLTGSIDLRKFKSAVCKMKGSDGTLKEGVFIAFEANSLENKDDHVYFNFVAFENNEIKYGNTHSIKQSFKKDQFTKEELSKMPFFGNIKPMGGAVSEPVQDTTLAVDAQPIAEGDMPF